MTARVIGVLSGPSFVNLDVCWFVDVGRKACLKRRAILNYSHQCLHAGETEATLRIFRHIVPAGLLCKEREQDLGSLGFWFGMVVGLNMP